MDRPLLIITFQGVIADFMPLNNKKQEKLSVDQKLLEAELAKNYLGLNLRAGSLEGLRYLSNYFQLVVFSRETIADYYSAQTGGREPRFGV